MPGDPNKKFEQNRLLDIEDGQYAWIGVESWTITDSGGSKTTKPGLVKREKSTNQQSGEVRMGKAKGFSGADLELVINRIDEIRGYLNA
jgi:hypothetical protein